MIITTDFDIQEKALVISYYDRNGEINLFRKPVHEADMFAWSKSESPTEHRNWDNTFLRQVPTKFMPRFRIEELIEDRLSRSEKDAIFASWDPKKYYLDIEIKLIDTGFPHPEEARMPVNLITLVNPKNVSYVLSTMEKFDSETIARMERETNEYFRDLNKGEPIKINYIYFEKEEDMLTTFFHKLLPKVPFLTGWNVIGFDWLYLVNRCDRLKIDSMKNMPGKLIGKARMPSHMGLVDYMEIFQKSRPIKVLENFKLDYISNLVLGVSKFKMEYNSMIEAQQDAYHFVMYNIIDTILVKFMEDRLSLLSVVFSIAKVARIEVSKVFSNVYIGETLLCREFMKRGKHLCTDKKPSVESSTYEGAYVMPPTPGYYKYVACYDFASMYPNVQIQFNISPDSFIGKGPVDGPHQIYTKNNTRFTDKFDSSSKTILLNMYNERKRLKKEMKEMKEVLKEKQRVPA